MTRTLIVPITVIRNRLAALPDLPVPRFARTLAAADEATRQAFQQVLSEHRLSSHLQCLARRTG